MNLLLYPSVALVSKRSSGPSFDPLSISGLTMWLDATDVTQAAGIVTAMHNKGSTATDPTINAGEEPEYTASNANYGGRPTWKCVVSEVIRATAGCHGILAAPRTIVMVGQCVDGKYALCDRGGGTAVGGGAGGGGNLWQMSSDGATWLESNGITNSPSVIVMVMNGASSKIYVNSLTPVTGNSGAAPDLTATSLHIGNYGSASPAAGQNGDTTHVLAYNSALSQADCEYLLNGLGAQSGITIGA